jgi:hypothetical protein
LHTSRALAAVLAVSASILVVANAGAAPPPCNGAAGIADVSGDGHHPGTDVLSAWFSDSSGHLQAVVQVRSGIWVAEHDDAEINGSGFAVLFTLGSQLAYIRANAPAQDHAADGVRYDYGTYTAPNTFQSAGATTGAVEAGPDGTVTIDLPAAFGVTAGTRLGNPFVLTYDGISGGVPDWVDHAPGGTDPADSARGADYIAGACGVVATPPPGGGPAPTTSVQLSAPKTVTGRKTVTITGKVLPARAGINVTLTRAAHATATTTATTAADGTFSARVAIGETTRLRAVAENVGSSELTVTAHSRVRIKLKHAKDGSVTVTGTVDPKFPGKVLWLRSNAVKPSARATTRNGTFRLRLKHPRPGRYQAVVIPNGARAERATSNTGVIR